VQFDTTLTRAVDELAGGIFDRSTEEEEAEVLPLRRGEDAENEVLVGKNQPLIKS
jgi:hypothetical protein